VEVSRLPADGAAAVAFDEVDKPIVVVLKAREVSERKYPSSVAKEGRDV
jgi:hypothetical protein